LLCNSGLKHTTQETKHVSFNPLTAQLLAHGPLITHQAQLSDAYNSHNIQQLFNETEYIRLLVFERKILKRIFGPTKENQIWRIKTNEELDKLIKLTNIINYIKAHRLSWFGHVQRMPDTRTVKKIFNWKPLTKRSQGKPKYRWED
jgi:hypothetical protein